MDFLSEYGLFLAKIATTVISIIILVATIIALSSKEKKHGKTKLTVKNLNEKYEDMSDTLNEAVMTKSEYKKQVKQENKIKKARAKEEKQGRKIYVLSFDGDIKASAVENFREEITAVLTVATPLDEVVVNIDSGGGMVHAYGLAASQLQRIREKKIPLTVCVDKIAASGGYLMACVADKIIAAPFAIIGSIGVIAQLPNFHRLLKDKHIDYEQITAGDYKRTLTIFGENTEKGRKKFQEEIEEVHSLFKTFIGEHRPFVNIDEIATGEHWLASRAKELRLVDELQTSDDYLLAASKQNADLYAVKYATKLPLMKKILQSACAGYEQLHGLFLEKNSKNYFYY